MKPGADGAGDAERRGRSWIVPDSATGVRLDVHVAETLGQPRNQVQAWLRGGRVLLDGKAATRASTRLEGGETVAAIPPEPEPSVLVAEPGDVPLLLDDADFLIVDKPAGLVVHPGAGQFSGTLVHRLLAAYPEIGHVGSASRPGIVHRIDAGTSGAIVVARTQEAYEKLSRAFRQRAVEKEYLAVAFGCPRPATGTIDRPIARDRRQRQRMTVSDTGRAAVTHYEVLAAASGASLLRLRIETGRTHQIRVHLKSIGRPLIGDPVYGENRWKSWRGAERRRVREFPRPALHAWRLGFRHPRDGSTVRAEAPLPADLAGLIENLFGSEPLLRLASQGVARPT